MIHKFEAVRLVDGQWTVQTQIRKNGNWYTVADTFCIPNLGDAKEIAEMIAELLNNKVNETEKSKANMKLLRKLKFSKSYSTIGKAKGHTVKNVIKDV